MAGDPTPDDVLPGTSLHGWLQRLVSPETMRRIVSPVLADYQREMVAVVSIRRVRRTMLGVRWAGSLVLALVLDWVSRPPSGVERRQCGQLWLRVFLACGTVTLLNVAAVMGGGVALRIGSLSAVAEMVLYILPSGLAIGIPCGVLFGSLAMAPTPSGRRRALGLAAVGGAIVVLLLLAFVVPPSNQAYRVVAWGALSAPGEKPAPGKGSREMSFGELREAAANNRLFAAPGDGRRFDAERHRRVALAASCIALVWFAAGLSGTLVAKSLPRRLAATVAVGTVYYVLFEVGTGLFLLRSQGSPAPIWLANVVFLVLGAIIHAAHLRRPSRAPLML